MASDAASRAGPPPRVWGPWLRVAAAALGLLLLSEVLWLWQTWPIRELLPSATRASSEGKI